MKVEREPGETRSADQIRDHYEVERELADRLRRANKEDRRRLYSKVYDELFLRVPHHEQHRTRASADETRRLVQHQLDFLGRFLDSSVTYLEIGAGDCALAVEVASRVRHVYALDVSAEIAPSVSGSAGNGPESSSVPPAPGNFELVLTDGIEIPVPAESVDVVYSHQLMEHLHPADAEEQLAGILAALRPSGCYICITPNRLNGPHDISRYFDREATGFHLKEYSITELASLFRRVGFRRIQAYFGGKGHYLRLPIPLVRLYEFMLIVLPYRARSFMARRQPVRAFLWPRIVAVKE